MNTATRVATRLSAVVAVTGIIAGLAGGIAAADTPTAPMIATAGSSIPVGAPVSGMAVSPSGQQAYLSDTATNTVRVLNLRTRTLEKVIRVGQTPGDVTLSPDGSALYVANTADGTISVINAATDTVTKTIRVDGPDAGVGPIGVRSTPGGNELYVDGTQTGRLYEVNVNSGQVQSVAVSAAPSTALVVGNEVVVGDYQTDEVALVNADTLTVTHVHRPDQSWTAAGAVVPGTDTVTLAGPAGTAWFDGYTGKFTGQAVGTMPGDAMGTATSSDGRYTFALYGAFPDAANPAPSVVQVFDNRTHLPVGTVQAAAWSWHIATAPGKILVSHGDPNSLTGNGVQVIPLTPPASLG